LITNKNVITTNKMISILYFRDVFLANNDRVIQLVFENSRSRRSRAD